MKGYGARRGCRLAAALAALGILAAGALASCARREDTVYATPDYPGWARTTDVVLDYPIPGHQDRFRVPRMNAVGFTVKATTEAGKRSWRFPEGTVIVKEIYATYAPRTGDSPIELTIMVKAPGDPRARGGWLWITRAIPDGTETVFAGNFCITCHANANERHPYGDGNPRQEFRDYVFYVPGSETPVSPSETPGY